MSPVTAHAVVRWLERVRRVDLSRLPPEWSNLRRAQCGCDHLRMSLDDAREAILPSRLHCYLDLDPRAVRGADRVLVVRERRVVTVLAAETRVLNQPEAA